MPQLKICRARPGGGRGLREDASQLDFAFPRHRVDLAAAPHGRRGRDRNADAVLLDVERGDRLAPCDSHRAAFRRSDSARAATSAPIASPRRSTALTLTSPPAKPSSNARPRAKDASPPTTASIRRTPGQHCVPSMSSSRSSGASDSMPLLGHRAEQADQALGPRPLAPHGRPAAAAGRQALVLGLAPARCSACRLPQRSEVGRARLAPGADDHSQQLPDFGADGVLDRA